MQIEEKRKALQKSIEKDVMSFCGKTVWGPPSNDKVIEMGKKFCEKLTDYANNMEDEGKAGQLCFFTHAIIPPFVATTRASEELGEEDLAVIGKVFDDISAVVEGFVNGNPFDEIFMQMIFIHEIFLTNAMRREDSDDKYRQYMIFPDYSDVYEIVHKVLSNWDKLNQDKDFSLLFVYFRREWYHKEINPDYYGDYIMDKINGWKGPKPETAVQDQDPRFYAREFIRMLDERISK